MAIFTQSKAIGVLNTSFTSLPSIWKAQPSPVRLEAAQHVPAGFKGARWGPPFASRVRGPAAGLFATAAAEGVCVQGAAPTGHCGPEPTAAWLVLLSH